MEKYLLCTLTNKENIQQATVLYLRINNISKQTAKISNAKRQKQVLEKTINTENREEIKTYFSKCSFFLF